MEGSLAVWAEHITGFMRVGTLSLREDGSESFAYDESYAKDEQAVPIFPVLPLQAEAFATQQTRAAFSSLGPEGPVGHDIRTALRAGRDAISPVLARLNHETVGALTFTTLYPDLSREMGMGIGAHRDIDNVEPDDFRLMARQLGIAWRQARDSIAQMAERLIPSMLESADALEREHPVNAVMVAERLVKDSRKRVDVALKATL